MPNTFVSTVNTLAKTIIVLQKNETIFFGSANKDYQGQYENTMYGPETSVKVLLPFYPELQETIEVTPTPIVDRTREVKCEKIFSVSVQVNNQDLSLGVKAFVQKRLMQFYKRIQVGTERFLADKLIAGATFIPVTDVSKLKTTKEIDWLYNARTMMDHLKMNSVDPIMVLNNQVANAVRKNLAQSQLSSDSISQSVIRRGLVGQISGIPVHESTDLLLHHAGKLAKVSPLILKIKSITKDSGNKYITGIAFNAYKSGTTPIDDISADAIKKYDGFVLKTTFCKQPISTETTEYVAFCRANADVASITDGTFSITLAQPLEIAQLSRTPAVGDEVVMLGDHTNNFLYTRYGLTAVNPPLEPLSAVVNKTVSSEGISCYVGQEGSVTKFTEIYRISTMLGATVFPENVIVLPIPADNASSVSSGYGFMDAVANGVAKRLEKNVAPKARKTKPKADAAESGGAVKADKNADATAKTEEA